MKNEDIMNLAISVANDTMTKGYGGPFGAVITDKEGNIVATGSNHVIKNNDPTAHGEIVCIRNACAKLGTYDLSNYILYTTAYPCPMCLSAIIWANIKTVYYGCSATDTSDIGFRDDFIYDYINNLQLSNTEKSNIITFHNIERTNCLKLFGKYTKLNPTIY